MHHAVGLATRKSSLKDQKAPLVMSPKDKIGKNT